MRRKKRSSQVLAFLMAAVMLLSVGISASAAEPERPAGDLLTGEQSTDDLIAGEQSTDDLLTDEQSTDDLIAGERSTDDLLTGERSTDDLLSDERSTDDLLTGERSTDDLLTGERPTAEFSPDITENADCAGTDDETSSQANMAGEREEDIADDNPSEEDIADINPSEEESGSDAYFDAMTPFTLADVEAYSVSMDDTEIPVSYFRLEGENEQDKEHPCTLTFAEGVTSIRGGMIQNHVPATVNNTDGLAHAFSYAHVGNTRVYYMGMLKIHEEDAVRDYVYYTTDTHITNKTVYAVLKEGEQISLVYDHGIYHQVEYRLLDKNGQPAEANLLGQTEDEIFGTNRAYAVADGKPFSAQITIPRGYQATVTVQRKDGTGEPLHTEKLGEMMSYWQPNAHKGGYNTIELESGSPKSMVLTDSFSIENITSDMVVTVKYEKVTEIKFNAYMWTRTTYATGRILIKNSDGNYETAKPKNSDLKIQGNSFIWEFDGITSSDKYTWEMDQLQINGERIRVPMTTMPEKDKVVSETTTLSTGTVVTLSVQSNGGTNGRDGRRHYILQIENCYEDLTISGGNMVGHIHREFAIYNLQGLAEPQVWPNTGVKGGGWSPLSPTTLIDKRNEPYNIKAPFRVKQAVGYENMHVRFTTKERGTVLQWDADCYGNPTYIEYLIRNDVENSADKLIEGTYYDPVPYSDWKASDDGFYYFRATSDLDRFMRGDSRNGVILISIYADPIKAAINYIDGAGDGDITGPLADNIEIMPQYQSGGENGYNILDNATALISNLVPVDKAGQWAFSHWEIAVVEDGKVTDQSKEDDHDAVIKIWPGDDIHVSEMAMEYLEDCLYRDGEKDRMILTLRAVWEKATKEQPIPYIVRYVLVDLDGTETQIEEHTHTVNVGAMLVTDLYQDTQKTLSESIKAVLGGENDYHKDYTLEGNWKVDEKRTTRKILSVSPDDHIATIYLVKQSTEVTVTKVWNDYDSPTRPKSIEVQLYKGADVPVGSPVTLSEGNWSHTFTGLPEIENGDPIVYTVREVTTPEGYTANVSVSGTAFTITNTKKTGDITVSKTVAGIGGDTDRDFHFTVTLSNPSINGDSINGNSINGDSGERTLTSINGDFGGMTFTDGVAHFTLKHGESKTASGLPVGITYEVTEAEADQDGYTTVATGANGEIAETESVVSFINTKKTGDITVSKTVAGIGGDTDRDFHFTVTLSNPSIDGDSGERILPSINGDFGEMTFTDGVAHFTLKHGESKTASGLPVGITYEVTEDEADQDGYTTVATGARGEIAETESVVSFINTKKTGNLTVSKTVAGIGGDTDRDFHFTVTLSSPSIDGDSINGNSGERILPSINGDFGEMTFTNGVAHFTLKHGESKTASGLPVGITYEVIEDEADQDGYTTVATGAAGEIAEAESVVSFINTKKTGDLTVSKTVAGIGGDTDRDFHFTVTLSNPFINANSGERTLTSINGDFGEMTFTDGVAHFTLKHGESKTASGLPVGITYEVTETEADQDGYTTVATGARGEIAETESVVSFINTKKTGDLTVSKTVAGIGGDTDRDFHFTVTLSSPSIDGDSINANSGERTLTSINGDFGEMTFTNGVAHFTLKHGESKTAAGLPVGITYEVTEDEADQDGYTTVATGARGEIAETESVVSFINTKKTGNLTVSKTVAGIGGDTDRDFHFTVTLSSPSIDGDSINGNSGERTLTSISGGFGEMTFTDGVAHFTLKHGESKTASGLPVGITYEVTEAEADQDGYTTVATGANGEIAETESVVSFINTKKTGDLTVSKTVAGIGGDTDRDFHFTVTLSNPFINGDSDERTLTSINGDFGEMTFTNGVAQFTLKHGESKTAAGLPVGITYEVTEDEADQDGYTTVATGARGEIAETESVVSFINTKKTGDLTVSKTVAGIGGDTDRDFHFTVTLSDPSINGTLPSINGDSDERTLTSINGDFGGMTFTDGVAHFTLKHGESKTASGLPVGITYEVTEDEADQDGYTTVATGAGGEIAETESVVSFINTKKTGNLTVSKTVAGIGGDTDRDFHFTVTLSDSSINGDFGGMTFTDGVAHFTLKHGESKTASGLPLGIAYEVTEDEADQDGYTTVATGAGGEIAETESVVSFINTKKTGNLTVSKTVAGIGGDTDRDFHFTVTLSSPSIDGDSINGNSGERILPSISGDFGEMTFTDGVAHFTLKHGERKTASGLPVGITYEVTETEADQDGYTTVATGASGEIAETESVVSFINTKKTGDITVSKTVAGIGGDTDRDFHFTVTLSSPSIDGDSINGNSGERILPSISGDFGEMTFTDGVAHFTLKHGERKTASGLPVGITYEVTETEADQDGYTTVATGAGGEIAETESVVSFINTKKTGDLTVSKTVAGIGGDTDRDFHFTVTLNNTFINGDFGGMTFTDGVAHFTLKHGESKTASGLPVGITYEVTEDEADQDGYTTVATGANGEIAETESVVSFINTKKTGDLTVSKTVAGIGGDTDRDFHFTVTLSNSSINGDFGEMTFTNGVAHFTLKHGESKTASGLPVGITYEVTETEADQDGYTTVATGANGEIAETESVVSFINTKKTGDLTVSKMVAGIGGDTDRDFHFTVTLSNPFINGDSGERTLTSINGDFGEMTFTNGVAHFTLKHGESKTASGLPVGITYEVTETEADQDGYTTVATGAGGEIAETESVVSFINHKDADPVIPDPDKPPIPDPDKPPIPDPDKPPVPDPDKPPVPDPNKPPKPDPDKPTKPDKPSADQSHPVDTPHTGDNSHLSLWFALLLVSGGVLIAAVIHSRKKQRR